MIASDDKDTLVVVNGPEDGNTFPILRSPLLVGTGQACTAALTLDQTVHPLQAKLTAVSDGYRVRSMSPAPVYIDGKRAGMYRSRVLRAGGDLKVGHTLITLRCAPGGLASRSRGIATDNDFLFALKALAGGVLRTGKGLLTRHWRATLVLAVVAAFLYSPALRHVVLGYLGLIGGKISGLLQGLI